MAYLPNIPQPTDALNISQGNLLNNFQFLNPVTQGIITFIVQSMSQPTAGTNIFQYARLSAATSQTEMVVERQNGNLIEYTSSNGNGTAGWGRTASNILFAWTYASSEVFPKTFVFSVNPGLNFPGFTSTPTVVSTTVTVGASPAFYVSIDSNNTNSTQVTFKSSGGTGGIAWLAIGFGPVT